jgi:hypothetical protein
LIVGSLLHLVQWQETGSTEIMLAEIVQTLLDTSSRLNDNVVKLAARSRDGNVVLFWNGSQVSQTTENSNIGELSPFLSSLKEALDSFGAHRAIGLESSFGFFGLGLCVG